MNFLQILSLTLIIIMFSCKSDKKRYEVEKISITSLMKSNEVILNLSNKNYSLLQDKLRQSIFGEKVEYWNSKAVKLRILTSDVINNIENLNVNDNSSIVTINLFKSRYMNEIKLIDSTFFKILNDKNNGFLTNLTMEFSPAFVIQKTKNDILLSEAKMTSYIDNKTSIIIEDFTIFSTLVNQNTKHLKAGETLIITAGIGSFTLAAKPQFVINGNTVKSDESGTARYTLKVTGNGKKAIPVKIFYISNKGSKESKEIEIDYYVEK